MAFVDRIVEFPGRFDITEVGSGVTKTYDLVPHEGEVQQDGTLLNAANMNDQIVNRYTPTFNVDTTAAAETDDGDLYQALTALGWTGDVGTSDSNVKALFVKLLKFLNGGGTITTVSSANTTIPANSSAWINVNAPSKSFAYVGYYVTGSALAFPYAARQTATGAQFAIRNTAAQSITIKVDVNFLCIS